MLNGSNALQRFIQYWGPIDRKPAPVQKNVKCEFLLKGATLPTKYVVLEGILSQISNLDL